MCVYVYIYIYVSVYIFSNRGPQMGGLWFVDKHEVLGDLLVCPDQGTGFSDNLIVNPVQHGKYDISS